MPLTETVRGLAQQVATAATSARECITSLEAGLTDPIQQAELRDDPDEAYTLRCQQFILGKLGRIVNSSESSLNGSQVEEVLRGIEDIFYLNLTDESSVREHCEHEFGRELRSLAAYVNSCRG